MNISQKISEAFRALTEVNGVQAANRAVASCAADVSMIFLPRTLYQDLVSRSRVPDLARYKGKTIVVVSDPIQ
jgi:hypothetical protein